MKETSQVIAAVKREVQLSEWQRQIQERRNPQIILRQIAKENLRVCISEVRCKYDWSFPGQSGFGTAQTCKVFLNIQSVHRGCGGKRVDNGTCLRALDGIGKQPVLSSHHKRADGILGAVVIYRNIAVLKTAIKIWLFIETILHRFGKLGASSDGKLVQPCEKGPSRIGFNRSCRWFCLSFAVRESFTCAPRSSLPSNSRSSRKISLQSSTPFAAALSASKALSMGNASANFRLA